MLKRCLLTAALNQYKILGHTTIFDLGEARIVSIDLDEVAKSGGVKSEHQTAVMYMLARHLITKNHRENFHSVIDMPYTSNLEAPERIPVSKYKLYHKTRIESLINARKIVCFDEFHRVSNNNVVNDQVVVDMREGRKWKIETMLATQSLSSVSESMKSLISSLFIMDSGSDKDIADLINFWELDSIKFIVS